MIKTFEAGEYDLFISVYKLLFLASEVAALDSVENLISPKILMMMRNAGC